MNFEVGSALIEDTLLVITDKTGTRKIRLGDLNQQLDYCNFVEQCGYRH
ncbi:MAG: hypothetical protein II968_00350 [Selenomonadaceae bacterium]|nr:hypothetical protein [Selenomonadaceae bacterium]MBR0261592.1 hypothetical protein [Selenomonadaceae bacterium]